MNVPAKDATSGSAGKVGGLSKGTESATLLGQCR